MKNLKILNSDEKIEIGKIVCVGRNYAAHAKELGNEIPDFPLIFLKPASVLISSGEKIIYPSYSNEMHHEIELVLLIGSSIKEANDTQAEDAILGYGVGLDMTLRDIQSELKSKGHPWTIAKCFDTAGVLSDFVLKSDYLLTENEKITLSINDNMKQDSNLSLMLFNPVEIVKYISTKMTLEKGDLIFTGTPKGVGIVNKGDYLFGQIENLPTLETYVI